MHNSSYQEMKRLLGTFPWSQRIRLLDVGSMDVNGSYRPIVSPMWEYVGADIAPGKNVDIVMPGAYQLPVADGEFDVVISGQCLEHVQRPWVLLPEMARTLRAGGTLIVTAPWSWNIHRYPLDCWRILPDGMAVLLNDAGLSHVKTYTNGCDCWGIALKTL